MAAASVPYIILIGNVGVGKSTLVEKVSGERGRSSSAMVSATRQSELLYSFDNSLLIADTPGANPIGKEKFHHNIWIAEAMNFLPFSLLLVVVKAETRIDNVIDNVRKYVENLLDLSDMLAVCVTHMDQVKWIEIEFRRYLSDELGIEKVVFSGSETSPEQLVEKLKLICCRKPMAFHIDHKNFLRYFKISNNNFKILASAKREVDEMISIKQQLLKYMREQTKNEDKPDLIFEFQTWVKDEIIAAQMRVAKDNKFTFMGENTANEAGHIANMTNQLRAVLFDIRNIALGYQSNHGISELRKCPHCGLIWAKLEGCNGATTCGNPVSSSIDSRRGIMCNFQFQRENANLMIQKTGESEITANSAASTNTNRLGCGRQIVWSDMPMVAVPEGFNISAGVNTNDLETLPAEAEQGWIDVFNDAISGMMKMFIG